MMQPARVYIIDFEKLTRSSVWNAVVDLVLVALPLQMIWHLKMPAKRKAGIGVALSTGFLSVLLLPSSHLFFWLT